MAVLERLQGQSIQREFLDWRKPALAAAADYLAAGCAQPPELDLGRTIVVVPGGRAGRRLRELLVALAEKRDLTLTPPQIVTQHDLPERLYQPQRPFADDLTQQLAWATALRSFSPAELKPYLPRPPAAPDTAGWLAVGEVLRQLHLGLAADGMDCKHVLAGAAAVEGFSEHERWQTLCQLQRAYLDVLDRLQLWDKQTARLVAIQKHEVASDRQIVLLGTVDLNRALRQMLDQIAGQVTALVVAPPDLAERFDAYGCLIPGKWTELELPVADDQIERVDGPADQAEAVTRWLADLGGRYRADQIAVGMPDERLVPQVERQLEQSGVRVRWAIGRKLPETGPYRLLHVAAEYAARWRFRDLAALVRHPDAFAWLERRLRKEGVHQPDILLALDNYAAERLPATLDEERLKKEPDCAKLLAIFQAARQLIEPLVCQPLTAGEWSERLRSVLALVYGGQRLDRDRELDRYLLEALKHLGQALDALAAVPAELQLRLDVREACRLALDSVAGQGLAPPADPDAVELLGWLELPLDDAPALVVTTFNEGYVPSALSADAFLPNRLRQHLGLLDNDRRLARDAYALSVLLASREKLKLLVAHRDTDGNPLTPSRLLFAADTDRVVERARAFFRELPAAPPRRNLLAAGGTRLISALEPPRPPAGIPPLTGLSVTQFRDYIACPYRFYLRHVLKLEALGDWADELDGGAFGNLVHLVLEQFGRADEARELRTSTEPGPIAGFLEEKLDRIAGARYGKQARAAVRVQIAQARLRLRAFAHWQAQRTGEGWRIVFSEDSEQRRTLTAEFAAEGGPFSLRGRIDRIDYHEQRRILAVLDYKTADAGFAPERTHRRAGAWIDLQLPLYRHLLGAAGLPIELKNLAGIELGYVLLPKDSLGVKHAPADWDEVLLSSADALARQVIAAIRAGKFWPPKSPPPDFSEDFAAICQDRRLGSWMPIGEEEAP